MENSSERQTHQGLTLYFLGKLHLGLKKLSAYYRQRGVRVFNITIPSELDAAVSTARPHALIIDLQNQGDITRFFEALDRFDGLLELPRIAIISSTADPDTSEALTAHADDSVAWPLKATDLSAKLFALLMSRGHFVEFDRSSTTETDQHEDRNRNEDQDRGDDEPAKGPIRPGFLLDIIQLLYLGRRDCVVGLESEGRRGTLFFKDGKLIDAQVGALGWQESLQQIRGFSRGSFVLTFQIVDRKRFIDRNVMAWLAQQREESEIQTKEVKDEAPTASASATVGALEGGASGAGSEGDEPEKTLPLASSEPRSADAEPPRDMPLGASPEESDVSRTISRTAPSIPSTKQGPVVDGSEETLDPMIPPPPKAAPAHRGGVGARVSLEASSEHVARSGPSGALRAEPDEDERTDKAFPPPPPSRRRETGIALLLGFIVFLAVVFLIYLRLGSKDDEFVATAGHDSQTHVGSSSSEVGSPSRKDVGTSDDGASSQGKSPAENASDIVAKAPRSGQDTIRIVPRETRVVVPTTKEGTRKVAPRVRETVEIIPIEDDRSARDVSISRGDSDSAAGKDKDAREIEHSKTASDKKSNVESSDREHEHLDSSGTSGKNESDEKPSVPSKDSSTAPSSTTLAASDAERTNRRKTSNASSEAGNPRDEDHSTDEAGAVASGTPTRVALAGPRGQAEGDRGRHAGIEDDVRAILKRAEALERAGKDKEALAQYESASKLLPSSRQADEGIKRIRKRLAVDPLTPGQLTINSFPYGIVYIDGEKQGYTPIFLKQAVPRKYLIRIVDEKGRSCSTEVLLKPGESRIVHLRFDDERSCPGANSTP